VNIGNQPWVLSRQERVLGLHSDLVVSSGTWLQYPADRCLHDSGTKTWQAVMRQSWFGINAALRYDVMHYYFGQSFFHWAASRGLPGGFLDLKLARLLGRKIFMTLQGCDARLSVRNSERNTITMCHLGNCQAAPVCRSVLDGRRKHLIDRVLPWCHRVFVLNPDMAHDIPGATFVPYANVDVESLAPVFPRTTGPIRLLHAPSDELIKGTKFLLEAVDKLKQRWPIELILVKGMPHAEAMQQYYKADLIVDQLLAGWYGGFAVEAMALGKPVAAYIRDSDLIHVSEPMKHQLPILRVTPHTLEHDLEHLFEQRSHWPEWGMRARQYVTRWHHPLRIARAMAQAYRAADSRFDLEAVPEESTSCAA
jgi:hypothetical protein